MTTQVALDLATQLVRDHAAAHERGQHRVIRVSHHDLAPDIPVLSAVADRTNGRLFDLNDESWVAPPGPINRIRKTLVEQKLPKRSLTFIDTDDVVAVEDDSSGILPSPSLTTLLRAAAVIASAAYDQAEVLIITARFDEADVDTRLDLFALLGMAPGDLAPDRPMTVILVLDDDGEFSTLGVKPSLNYLTLPDRVHRRDEAIAAHATRAVRTTPAGAPFVLFFGAGASASAGIKLGDEYRNAAIRDLLDNPDADTDGLPELFVDYLSSSGRFSENERTDHDTVAKTLTLERVLRETFHTLGPQPRSETAAIAQLIEHCSRALSYHRPGRVALQDIITKRLGRPIIVTVNFDQLIENGIEEHVEIIATPDEFTSAREHIIRYLNGEAVKVPLLKIHGTIDRPDTLIATIDETAAGLTPSVREMLQLIVGAHDPVPWIWIGCSMRDKDVNAWLHVHQDKLNTWWVDPRPGASLQAFFDGHLRAAWRAQERTLADRLIIDTADGFLPQLRDRLQRP